MMKVTLVSYGILLSIILLGSYGYKIISLWRYRDWKGVLWILRKLVEEMPLCLSIFLYTYDIQISLPIFWQGYSIFFVIIYVYRIFLEPQSEPRNQIRKEFAENRLYVVTAVIAMMLLFLPAYIILVLYAFGL